MMQRGDAFSAVVGGAATGSLESFPHALIAAHGGDTVAAALSLAAILPQSVPLVVLADYENDAVATSLAVARALDGRLWGVRLDTGEYMIDKSVIPQMGSFPPTGVTPHLVWNVRNALDADGHGDVKIVVSGGLDEARIAHFEEEGVPVDAYGVGAGVHAGRWDFTADVVRLAGAPQAKAGREHRPNPKLEKVK